MSKRSHRNANLRTTIIITITIIIINSGHVYARKPEHIRIRNAVLMRSSIHESIFRYVIKKLISNWSQKQKSIKKASKKHQPTQSINYTRLQKLSHNQISTTAIIK